MLLSATCLPSSLVKLDANFFFPGAIEVVVDYFNPNL